MFLVSRPKKKKAPVRSPASTATGRLNVILERVEEQQRVVIEAVSSTREALERKIDGVDQKLSSRMDVIEFVVRKNGEDIRALADKLDTKADAVKVASLERRVESLEIPPS